ncbi:MAG: FAD-binding oxidoreductase [Symploca sp. SIO1B1]|nr:FAD-binding oxidoreductase [Symploca sp. SIO1B1]
MDSKDFKQALQGIRVISEEDPDYERSRQIQNTRFNYKPFYIVKCKNTDDVIKTIKLCQREHKSVRICSGGHQHEGMCSADNVVIIDLSCMGEISVCKDSCTAWIEPGAQLQQVYQDLEANDFTLPGGGGNTVNVGGLVQGGGWGMLARVGGLTCDSLQEVNLVTATGTPIKVTQDNQYQDLFWGLKGGGGGNFGVITKYKFQLMKHQKSRLIAIRYASAEEPILLTKLLDCYLNELPSFDDQITSFARVSHYNDQKQESCLTFTITFNCFGCEQIIYNQVRDFFERLSNLKQREGGHGELEWETIDTQLEISDTDLLINSSVALPHKVSSAFPKGDIAQLSQKIIDFVDKHKNFDKAATYLSIHSLGGKIRQISADSSSFFYRDKEFLLQFQAWWQQPNDDKSEDYINWIRDFRQELDKAGCIEGAFINFPDQTIVEPSGDEKADKIRLLRYYYGNNLDCLREIKAKYDPNNFFSFGMSIPPK